MLCLPFDPFQTRTFGSGGIIHRNRGERAKSMNQSAIGILLLILAGAMNGSITLPMKFTKKWHLRRGAPDGNGSPSADSALRTVLSRRRAGIRRAELDAARRHAEWPSSLHPDRV